MGFPGTSDVTRNTWRRPRSTPPSSRPSGNILGGWNFSPFQSDTRVQREQRTLEYLTAAFSTVRPKVDHNSASKGASQPSTDSNAKGHNYLLFKSPMDALSNLAHSRLLGIIRNKKRLVESLPWAIRRTRAHSAATPTHTHTVTQQGVATHTHRTRTTRVPESTVIT